MKIRLKSHKDLIVWQKAMNLIIKVYKSTGLFPKEELYGLTSQMRRAAVAIPSNITEGYQRNSLKEYIQFLYIARASAAELETQLLAAKGLDFINNGEYSTIDELLTEILKMLNSLIQKLKAKPYPLKPNS